VTKPALSEPEPATLRMRGPCAASVSRISRTSAARSRARARGRCRWSGRTGTEIRVILPLDRVTSTCTGPSAVPVTVPVPSLIVAALLADMIAAIGT
jgi:hypothetical protein